MSNEFQPAESQNLEPAAPVEPPQTPQPAVDAAGHVVHYAAPTQEPVESAPLEYYASAAHTPAEGYAPVETYPQAEAYPQQSEYAPAPEPTLYYYYDHEGNPVYYHQPHEAPAPEYHSQEYAAYAYPSETSYLEDSLMLAPAEALVADDSRPVTNLWKRPYLWASLPPFALLALTLALGRTPLPHAIGPVAYSKNGQVAYTTTTSPTGLIVPASETYVVSRQAEGHRVLLRGVAEQPLGKTLLASSSGQVARVAVKPGQMVHGGQEILALSTRAVSESAPPLPAEVRDYGAERAQIAAVRAQRNWQDKVQSAHDRMEQAQQRVQAAQDRVARARDLVSRLQRGEAVEAAATSTPAPPPRRVKIRTASSGAREAAMRKSRDLQAEADKYAREAASARKTALLAEQSASAKQKAWQDAQSTADSIEVSKPDTAPAPDGDTGKDTPKPSNDGSASRKRMAQVRADFLKDGANDASTRAAGLRRDANRLSALASSSQNKANDAARRAADMQNFQVFEHENEPDAPAPRIAQNTDAPSHVSIEEAVRIAREAMDESRQAVANAERIRKEVEGYERPVETTRERFDSATRRLNNAQEQIWRNVPVNSANISPITTPDTGVVLWVAEQTREVRAGDPLAAVGRTDRLEVVLQDSSNAWKSLKTGSTIMALIQNEPGTFESDSGMARPTSMGGAGKPMNGRPTMARVLSIVPPNHPGAAAYLRVAIHNPRRSGISAKNQDYGIAGRIFEPGTPVLCSVTEPGDKRQQVVAIPSAAIRMDPQKNCYVAVLAPVGNSVQDVNADLCRIEWRQVKLGRGDGVQNVVLSGLEPGERIALRPDAMQNFTLAHGAQATLRVEQA